MEHYFFDVVIIIVIFYIEMIARKVDFHKWKEKQNTTYLYEISFSSVDFHGY